MIDIDYKGKKVLITGSAGFIGSHLTEELLRAGADVRAFVRYTSSRDIGLLKKLDKKLLSKLDVYFGDLRDIQSVKSAMKGQDIVFHLGALIGVPYSFIHPHEVVINNIKATLNVLESFKNLGLEKLVITSTSEVYGTAEFSPITEEHPLKPQSPYSASKIASDSIALSYYYAYELPIVILRPFNTFGPRQSLRAVIPTIISQAILRGEVELGRIDTKRDFTYVKDTVRGFMKVGLSSEVIGKVLNLGSGKARTIEEVVKIVGKILGRELKIKVSQKRFRPGKSEVELLLASYEKAKKIINWEPIVPFEEGIAITVKYIKENIREYDQTNYIV